MDILMDILVAMLVTWGLVTAVWAIVGILMAPAGAKGGFVTALVRAEGPARELENTVDGLRWLNRSGLAHMDIIIADAGMDTEARKVAELLARDDGRNPNMQPGRTWANP